MNNNLVLTIAVGTYEEMGKVSHSLQRAYADKIGADYLVINQADLRKHVSPHWEKFQIFDLLGKYKRILFVDTDILIRDDTPNLFDLVPVGVFGAFNEYSFTDPISRKMSLMETCKEYGATLPNWDNKYYNTGVMVISRSHREIFRPPEKEFFSFFEQGYINMMVQKSETKCQELPYKFNRMPCMDKVTGEERFASYLMHYAGAMNVPFTIDLMKSDIENWKKHAPEYKYQRHILVDVQGGLGDQIDAEPSIRYMKKHIYPDDDMVVKTHWTRIFQHLEVPVYTHTEWVPKNDTPYFHVVTLPGLDTLQWTIVSNLLCHTVDFASMALMRRTLPTEDKQIQLSVNDEDRQEVEKLLPNIDFSDVILVHPGTHWESKTLPKQWWQDVIDGLYDSGKKIIVIGKDDDTRGAWSLELRDGMIDLCNLLSLGALFYLISKCPVLISNDSAPVHIAGAFDNKIVLIPTCKHPDHILPYRGTDRNHKQISLYRKLTLDDCEQAPTIVHGATAEFIKDGWDKYLLTPAETVKRTLEFLSDESVEKPMECALAER